MSGNLIYFELSGNTAFFTGRAEELGFRLLKAETPFGIAGLGRTHSVLRIIGEMRREPLMQFCFTLRNPNEDCFRKLQTLGLQRPVLSAFVIIEENIKAGDLLVCEESGGTYFVIARPSKSERQNPMKEPMLLMRERTTLFAEFGKDFTIDEADFSRFPF